MHICKFLTLLSEKCIICVFIYGLFMYFLFFIMYFI